MDPWPLKIADDRHVESVRVDRADVPPLLTVLSEIDKARITPYHPILPFRGQISHSPGDVADRPSELDQTILISARPELPRFGMNPPIPPHAPATRQSVL